MVPDRRPIEIRAVFAHYRKYHKRAAPNPNSKSKDWQLIRARLNEGYSVADLCLAIDGCHRSAFNQGDNDRGKRYDALELIVRNSSKVTQFMDLAELPDPKGKESHSKFGEAYRMSMEIAKKWDAEQARKDEETRQRAQMENSDATHDNE